MTNSAAIYFPSDQIESQYIKSIWRLQDADTTPKTEIILPKGTIEIIFNLSNNITYFNPSLHIEKILPVCFINGINFKPFQLIKCGQQEFLGIQFNTIGLRSLFNISIKELNDSIIEGGLICKSLDSLIQLLYESTCFETQVAIIRHWLHLKIASSPTKKVTDYVNHLFQNTKTDEVSVKKLCSERFISDRHLRRLSVEWLGMNTETFIHYNKYLASLQLLHQSTCSLTQIGLDAGYYDQSHFIREFKFFTQMTPGEYQKASKGIPGHIYDYK